MIIDAHTHIFPPDVIDRRELYTKRDASFGSVYQNPKAKMVTYGQLIEEMDSSGVDKAIVCGFPWKSLDLCRMHNDYMIEAVKDFPERFTGLAMVNPVAGKASDAELERCFSGGLSGVGEISADMQGFRLDNSTTMGRIVGAVEEAGGFILIHSNEDVGHKYPGKTTITPAAVYAYAEAFPDTPTILAHWGGGLVFYELMPEVAKLTSSIYYDTAASPYLFRSDIYKTAVEIAGQGRILFGTDFPLIRMSRHLAEIEGSSLSKSAREDILGKNAMALIGIKF